MFERVVKCVDYLELRVSEFVLAPLKFLAVVDRLVANGPVCSRVVAG